MFLPTAWSSVKLNSPILSNLIFSSFCKKSNAGGKGIRGVLVKIGYQIAGGKNKKAILDIASAYEIFHTSILAHDDIIDKSTQRRGEPSLYEALGGKHYGISQAICLAD